MNTSNSKQINDFIKQFPTDEVISTLNSIDKKISSLHSISSKDFLYFNALLKEYYSKIKQISDANNEISVFFSKKIPELVDEIKEKNKKAKDYIDHSKNNNSKVIEYLSIIYSSFDLVIVPFNNYKQNLITFKYLLANLKLHLGYVELANGKELKSSVLSIEKHIDTIYSQFEEIANRTQNVSHNIINLKEFAVLAQTKNSNEVYDKLKAISNKIKKISIDEYLPGNYTLDLTRRTQNCFANMGEVITNIQYHDIIRQKMEHIQKSQKTLIDELNKIASTGDNNTITNQLDFLIRIPEITDIQVAQLLYTNRDYQTSIEKITSKLIGVGHEMKEINSIYRAVTTNIASFEDSFISEISGNQESFSTYIKSINTNCNSITNKYNKIHTEYHNLKTDYNVIFDNEKQLRKAIITFEKLIEINGKNFGKELVKRLIQLVSDLQFNSNSIKSNLNNITGNFRTLDNLVSTFNCEYKLFPNQSEIISKLHSDTSQTKGICENFTNLSITISEEITSSIKKIEYYIFFKNTVEEIVTALNSINDIVNYKSLKELVSDNKEILDKIQQIYTMKSERDIHEMLTESGKNISDIIENENIDMDEHDIELF
ncbi:MAG: hypothetical protein JEZ09_01465 [Salinivirgaceae bacterium]|nr:hypothetical protein [Salinivirgaceae bacterium]